MMVCADPEAAGGGAVEHVFAQKNDAGGSPYAQAILAAHADSTAAYSSGRFSFFVYNGGTSIGASAASLCDGLPHQWTGVRSGTTYTLYKDGDVAATNTGSAVAITQNPSRYLALGSRGNGTTEAYRDRLYYAFAWNRALTQAEISTIYSDPYSLFNKRKAKTVVYFGGAGAGTNLAIQDASHAHAAEPPVLTTEWLLSIADAANAHLADSPTLSTDSVLAVAEALHAHVADNLGLTAAAWLAIADAVHAHLADGVTLTTASVLAILEAVHAHAAEALDLFFSSFSQAQLDEILAYVEANMAVPSAAQIAAAVWAEVLEGTLTAADMQRIKLAALAGKRQGLAEGPGTVTYFGQDGITPRVTLAHDGYGNGTPTVDGS